ncbi:recombinase family protein [Blautia sp. MSJ-9]|uniref:recombinase family protein n=1 Tax=Blautia sp. MSJ-9 TaxID=2841511 RepID=UPI000E4A1758|nr:recombinase family protein [Blautia sp. MSJ-9]MBU5680539.1 recombinase family protein [Blautia sp. MSJ-9]RHG54186.1 resolvase [Ruminococcus sp. AM22-13]
MCKTFAYMRISTKEERGKQKFTRQEQAIERWCRENNIEIPERRIYRDDASGKSFERPSWKELIQDIQIGDTIVFKDICRFTREYENGFKEYMKLLDKGINLVFLDNPTISTEYIKNMMGVAERQQNRIAKKSLKDTIELLILVELDRAEQEREITVKRIKDGIAASNKKSGRKTGQLDKMTPELKADIQKFLVDRSIKQVDLMNKYHISRNTLKKYITIVSSKE